MGYPHRINLTTEQLPSSTPKFMVNKRLPSARVAAQRMIELAAKVAEAEETTESTMPRVAIEHEKN